MSRAGEKAEVFKPKVDKVNYTSMKDFRPMSLTSFILRVDGLVVKYIQDGSLSRKSLKGNQHGTIQRDSPEYY